MAASGIFLAPTGGVTSHQVPPGVSPQLQPHELDFLKWAGPSASSTLVLACDSETNNNYSSDNYGFLSSWYVYSLSFSTLLLNLTTTLPEDCLISTGRY